MTDAIRTSIIVPRQGLQLRKIGKQYMIVDAITDNVNLTNVFSLNEQAALMWQRVNEGCFSACEIAQWLAEQYKLTAADVQADVERQLDEWQDFGLVDFKQ